LQQTLAEQPIVDDAVGLGPCRWSFSEHLLIEGLIAMIVNAGVALLPLLTHLKFYTNRLFDL
jgi:hypothetical protein